MGRYSNHPMLTVFQLVYLSLLIKLASANTSCTLPISVFPPFECGIMWSMWVMSPFWASSCVIFLPVNGHIVFCLLQSGILHLSGADLRLSFWKINPFSLRSGINSLSNNFNLCSSFGAVLAPYKSANVDNDLPLALYCALLSARCGLTHSLYVSKNSFNFNFLRLSRASWKSFL